jgi:hypothetical protein
MKKLIFILLIFCFACAVKQEREVFYQEKPKKAPENKILVSQYKKTEDIKKIDQNTYEAYGIWEIAADISPKKARENAIKEACNKIIEYAGGVKIQTSSFYFQNPLVNDFYNFSIQDTKAIILKKDIIKEENLVLDGNIVKKVLVRAKIGIVKGEKDPYFNLKAEINRNNFQENDEVKIEAKASKDCYLTVLNIAYDGFIYLLFPNKLRKNNFLKKGKKLYIPDSKNPKMRLKAALLEGEEKAYEFFQVIATKERLDFIFNEFSDYGTYKGSFENIMMQIVNIPKSEIEIKSIPYSVSKN